MTLSLDFSSGSPFKESLPSSATTGSSDYTFSSGGKDYIFKISNSTGGYRWTGSCLRLNDGYSGTGDGAILVPAVPGMSLCSVSVVVVTNTDGKTVSVGSSQTSSDLAAKTAGAGVKTIIPVTGKENTA